MTDLSSPTVHSEAQRPETGTPSIDFGVMNCMRRSFKLPWQPKPFQAGSRRTCIGVSRAGYYGGWHRQDWHVHLRRHLPVPCRVGGKCRKKTFNSPSRPAEVFYES